MTRSGSSKDAGPCGLTVSALRPFSNSHRYSPLLKRNPMQEWSLRSCGCFGIGVRFEVRRRSHHGETHLSGHADRNHVPLNEFTKLHTCVVLSGDKIDRVVGRRDLQHDLRIPASKLSQLRQKHRLGRGARDDEPYPSRRSSPSASGSPQALAQSAPGRASVPGEAPCPPQSERRFALFARAIEAPNSSQVPEWNG